MEKNGDTRDLPKVGNMGAMSASRLSSPAQTRKNLGGQGSKKILFCIIDGSTLAGKYSSSNSANIEEKYERKIKHEYLFLSNSRSPAARHACARGAAG
jgi:hypothetical protein